jgi:hypothetical protein
VRKKKVDQLIRKFQQEAEQRGRADGRREGRKLARDEMEFVMKAPEDALVLGQQPLHRYFRVVLTPRRAVNFQSLASLAHMHPDLLHLRLANFEAVRKSWTSGEGHTVCWYDWEFKGVSF